MIAINKLKLSPNNNNIILRLYLNIILIRGIIVMSQHNNSIKIISRHNKKFQISINFNL